MSVKPKKAIAIPSKIVVFDLETDPISKAFYHATGKTERKKHAPKPRVGCTYDIETGIYYHFESSDISDLIDQLKMADKVISFNGKNFDILVLQKHCGLSSEDARKLNMKHTDICEEVEKRFGERRKLNNLTILNLGEQKRRFLKTLNLDDLKINCQSDVRQTYELYVKFINGTLKFPWSEKWRAQFTTIDADMIHSHLPDVSPFHFIPQNLEDMTDGQMADYLAGTWGVLDDDDFTFVDA